MKNVKNVFLHLRCYRLLSLCQARSDLNSVLGVSGLVCGLAVFPMMSNKTESSTPRPRLRPRLRLFTTVPVGALYRAVPSADTRRLGLLLIVSSLRKLCSKLRANGRIYTELYIFVNLVAFAVFMRCCRLH